MWEREKRKGEGLVTLNDRVESFGYWSFFRLKVQMLIVNRVEFCQKRIWYDWQKREIEEDEFVEESELDRSIVWEHKKRFQSSLLRRFENRFKSFRRSWKTSFEFLLDMHYLSKDYLCIRSISSHCDQRCGFKNSSLG